METVVQSQDENDLRLLLEWDPSADRRWWRQAIPISVVAHVVAIVALLLAPQDAPPAKPIARKVRVTPLIAPPTELTQKALNKGKVSKEFNVEALLPRPRIQIPESAPSTTRPAAPRPAPPPAQPVPLPPELPKIEAAVKETPKLPETAAPQPPQIQPQEKPAEKPKLAFENVGAPSTPPAKGAGISRPIGAGNPVDQAVRNLSHGGASPSGGVMVGDAGSGAGGVGEAINQAPAPGKRGSALELLSDPMGVDFRPYLLQILSTVRRNWFAVMPESANLGRRGKVALQFAISRDGSVVKIVFASNSGAESLDRAAVASISMSHPFPPLPAEYRGDTIRLQFTFQYNMPTN
jgi:TonB family protein